MQTSNTRRYFHWAVACACLLAFQAAASAVQTPDTADAAGALQAFNARVNHYVRLRERLEEPLPSFDIRRDPWSLMLTRRFLASAIRSARSDARIGDVFTPAVGHMFRGLIRNGARSVGEGGPAYKEPLDDLLVDVAINEPIPRWAMKSIPAALLQRLPPLPAEVEYRVVGDALVLWDLDAEIVIDALPGAFANE
jgi:hypothetical protein